MIGLKCPKHLWCVFNAPEKIKKFQNQALLQQGIDIGKLATKLYPGIDIPFKNAIQLTKEALTKHQPLFEASFIVNNSYCKVDILRPIDNHWDIIEVKSSTTVKEDHLYDVAFQTYCLNKAGLTIGKSNVMVINTSYVRDQIIDLQQLFKLHDVTSDIAPMIDAVEENIDRMLGIIKGPMPTPTYGVDCVSPLDCPVCSQDLTGATVLDLYRIGASAWPLINVGIRDVNNIPKEFALNAKQRLQKECIIKGTPYVNKEQLTAYIKHLTYPIYCLDFEAFNPPLPPYPGTRPYQHIPFQFSVHRITSDGTQSHHEFLADAAHDTRPQVLHALKKVIGTDGTVLTFNMQFEKKVLEELAHCYPAERAWIHNTIQRVDDLLVPFREFFVYHPLQHGSNSIKAILPALTGESYDGLEIGDGTAAAKTFESLMTQSLPAADIAKLRTNLLRYCKKDTEGMVKVLEKLRLLSK